MRAPDPSVAGRWKLFIRAVGCAVSEGRRRMRVHANTYVDSQRPRLQLRRSAENVPSGGHRTTGKNGEVKNNRSRLEVLVAVFGHLHV